MHQATLPADRLAALPASDREALHGMRRRIDEAEVNLRVAQGAQEEACRFRELSETQLGAADGEVISDPYAATARFRLAQAKRDYAAQLVVLREAELDVRHTELALARAELDLAQLRALQRNGLAEGLSPARFQKEHSSAQRALGRARDKVTLQQTRMAQLRDAWDARRRAAGLAHQP